MERSADGDILSSVWNSRRQVVEETAGEEGCNKEIPGKIRRNPAQKRYLYPAQTETGKKSIKKSVVDHPKSENMETEDLKNRQKFSFRYIC